MVKNLPANAGDAKDMDLIPGSGRKQQTWSRKPQTTLAFSPGKFHGQKSLVDYSLRGRKESDMNELLNTQYTQAKIWVLLKKQGLSVLWSKNSLSYSSQIMHWLMWLQPNVVSFRCRKPTLTIQTFNFRRKPSGTVKEQLPALPPAKSELCSTERNSPARSLSRTNSIPQFMVLALGKFRVLHSRYVVLRNNLNAAPLLPLSSLLPSSPHRSLHSRCTGFLTTHGMHQAYCYF